ncbi:MAG: hypothetical protein Ct9H300mP28_14540 [Pseudomonadota bacterium]|nr:MAG: hypothetical protein Ct9H300mP28_14540 [Pseudomonadota bacterium]
MSAGIPFYYVCKRVYKSVLPFRLSVTISFWPLEYHEPPLTLRKLLETRAPELFEVSNLQVVSLD